MAKAKTYIGNVYTEGKDQFIKLPKSLHIAEGKITLCHAIDHPNVVTLKPKKKMTTKEFLASMPALGDDLVITRVVNI